MQTMFEAEITAVTGPKGKHNPAPAAVRVVATTRSTRPAQRPHRALCPVRVRFLYERPCGCGHTPRPLSASARAEESRWFSSSTLLASTAPASRSSGPRTESGSWKAFRRSICRRLKSGWMAFVPAAEREYCAGASSCAGRPITYGDALYWLFGRVLGGDPEGLGVTGPFSRTAGLLLSFYGIVVLVGILERVIEQQIEQNLASGPALVRLLIKERRRRPGWRRWSRGPVGGVGHGYAERCARESSDPRKTQQVDQDGIAGLVSV
jgi:hypothetical protein